MESEPFAGVVLCCTSIPVDLRTDIAKKVTELGGVHKNDLTHEVTHLVVGDYNTPKYRHVACERPDIKPMCVGWVDAVLDLWTRDLPIDMPALEAEWKLKTFEVHGGFPAGADGKPVERGRLLCSMTGFEEEDRQAVVSTITENGGIYSGDLTRVVTHLIVNKPEGKKYAAAMHWNIKAVSIEWLRDSAARGMILDETKYDPRLPPHERGKGAWARTAAERSAILGKRPRDAAAQAAASAAANEKNGQRKLRKTASKKLSVQRDDLWGHILGQPAESTGPKAGPDSDAAAFADPSNDDEHMHQQQPLPPQRPVHDAPLARPSSTVAAQNRPPQLHPPTADTGGVLSTSIFCIHGFSPERTEVLTNAVATMGGHVATSIPAMAALATTSQYPSTLRKHVIVPQTERPEAHPEGDFLLVTEFFIEKCLHKKQYAFPAGATNRNPPNDSSIIGLPFRTFPIPDFNTLSICTSGFTGVDLNQVDKTVRQLGAVYEERFTAQCSVLVVTSLPAVRKQKLELALSWKVPVVDAKWLWACIASGTFVAIDAYLFPQLRQNPSSLSGAAAAASRKKQADPDSEASMALTVPTLVMPSPRSVLTTAQQQIERGGAQDRYRRGDTIDDDTDMDSTAAYDTAPTHFESAAGKINTAAPQRENAPLANPFNYRRSKSPPKRNETPQPQPPPPVQVAAPAPAPAPALAQPQTRLQQQSRKPFGRVASEIADSAAGDSDDTIDSEEERNNDGPFGGGSRRQSRAASANISPTKHHLSEAAAPAGASTGMKRSSTMAAPMARSSTSAAASRPKHRPALSRVASDGFPAAQAIHHPPVPIGISLGDLMKDGGKHARSGLAGFGRSHSSVSGMSVPEGDGGIAGAAASSAATEDASRRNHGTAATDNAGDDPPSQSLLPPTQVQVQYLDPEADRIREQLMRKIMGGADTPASESSSEHSGIDGGKENAAPSAHPLGTAEEALAEVGRASRRRSSRLR